MKTLKNWNFRFLLVRFYSIFLPFYLPWYSFRLGKMKSSNNKQDDCNNVFLFHLATAHFWANEIRNGQSKICRRQPLKIWSDMICLKRPHNSKFFKVCLPQILLSLFLNTLFHLCKWTSCKIYLTQRKTFPNLEYYSTDVD